MPVTVSETDIRRATASYYAMTEKLDSHFGEILTRLEELGEDLDEWIIIYTSDHGEMLGEHGIWEKTRFYEASVRVPLTIRWPAGFDGGRVINKNVNLCDLFATLCDLADIEIPDNLDSRSLAPLLCEKTAYWNNESISQMNKSHVMIKQDFLKYQYYGEEVQEVLFDLEKDPDETSNVADNPEHSEAMSKFRSRLAQLGHGPDADLNYKNAGYQSVSNNTMQLLEMRLRIAEDSRPSQSGASSEHPRCPVDCYREPLRFRYLRERPLHCRAFHRDWSPETSPVLQAPSGFPQA